MTQYLNDTPIERPTEDKYGFDPFAQALAESIISANDTIGSAIAINGSWGSGKSSAINLVKYHLRETLDAEQLTIVDFRCWWFRGEDALTLAFLQDIFRALRTGVGDKVSALIPKLARALLQTGPVVGAGVALTGGILLGPLLWRSIDLTKTFFPEDGVEQLFSQLSSTLKNQDRRFLVVIDDLDRLSSDEMILMFRLIKSVGHLPKMTYLLAFDKHAANAVVIRNYPADGANFLEKIIQATFDLPLPHHDDLSKVLLSEIYSLYPPLKDDMSNDVIASFRQAVANHVNNPRDIVRLLNSLSVTWPPVSGDVDPIDFIALENIRIRNIGLYDVIRQHKSDLCGTSEPSPSLLSQLKLDDTTEDGRRGAFNDTLIYLFPKLDRATSYSDDFNKFWERRRRLCSVRHFDTYFRFSVSDDTVNKNTVDDLIQRAGDPAFVSSEFSNAASRVRRDGTSQVPVLFHDIDLRRDEVRVEHLGGWFNGILVIADEIDQPQDVNLLSGPWGNLALINRNVRSLMMDRISIDRREAVILSAIQVAGLGAYVNLTWEAVQDYFPVGDKPAAPIEKCLITKRGTEELRREAIYRLNEASKGGSLLQHRRLRDLLFRWYDLSEDKREVRVWTSSLLSDRAALERIALAFTEGSGVGAGAKRDSSSKERDKRVEWDQVLDRGELSRHLETARGDDASPTSPLIDALLKAWPNSEEKT